MSDDEPGRLGGTPERPARFFSGPEEFAAWLARHHATETELWMGMHKKHVPQQGITYPEAVREALCWGWIDSTAQRVDDDTVRQRWTPRKRTSHWSKVNLALVEELRAAGRMQPAGLAIYEQRRPEPAPYTHEVDGELAFPDDYAAQLAADPAATAFWEVATPSYRKICVNWVMSAKQQATRDRRMAQLIEAHAAGEVIPSQRYGEIPKWVARAAEAAAAATRP